MHDWLNFQVHTFPITAKPDFVFVELMILFFNDRTKQGDIHATD